MKPQFRFTVLGPLSCTMNGERVSLGGAKQQMVLSLLLMEANSVVSVDRLIDWVWPEAEGGGGSPSTLQVYVSNLRRLLSGTGSSDRVLISTERPGYKISLEPGELDLLEFQTLVDSTAGCSRSDNPAQMAAALRRGLELWKGDCLSGLPIDASDLGITAGIEQARVSARERLAEVELASGRHREILADLQEWVALSPLDEHLRGHLMLALYRCGRQADALATYQQGRELLVEELGIDPSRELRDLEERILNQDPELDYVARRIDLFEDAESTRLRESTLRSNARIRIYDRTVVLDASTTTIGRMADRDIVVADIGASRRHCEIRRSGNAYRIVDSGSSNGTVVNGERIAESLLVDGDEIRIGDTLLVFENEPD